MTRVFPCALCALALSVAASHAKAVGIETIYKTVTIAPGSVRTAIDADCTAGVVVGGSWYSNGDSDMFVYRSRRDGNGWRIGARNTDPNNSISATSIAYCATG
ncbi:MAG: hypothetical protein JW940_27760, partial [Polyangiaceae bacterium]|nr:hypothetical protein [Polyangiaceae bacterium]